MTRMAKHVWVKLTGKIFPPENTPVWTTDHVTVEKGAWSWDENLGCTRWEDAEGFFLTPHAWLPLEESPDGRPPVPRDWASFIMDMSEAELLDLVPWGLQPGVILISIPNLDDPEQPPEVVTIVVEPDDTREDVAGKLVIEAGDSLDNRGAFAPPAPWPPPKPEDKDKSAE